MRVASRERVNVTINRALMGIMVKVGDLDLVREASSTRTREWCGNKLHPEKDTDPWTVKRVLQTGLSVEVEIQNRRTRKHTVATSALKPFNDGWHADGYFLRRG